MRKRRILLVDDDVSITRALGCYLSEFGDCEVRAENKGSRAVAAAREFRPDVIFLDIMMPDADGAAVAAQIQADPTLRHTPVVFLTALVSRRETGGAATYAGGYAFLPKPAHPETVLACIGKQLPELTPKPEVMAAAA
jgi:CheY-like chemotaxis protein